MPLLSLRARRAAIHYDVTPRYSAGGPARVDEEAALHVAEQERDAYQDYVDGLCGEAERRRAEALGLGGIVEEWIETRRGWIVRDLLTGERAFWPFEARCPSCGRRRIPCRRGRLVEHQDRTGRPCAGKGAFVGEVLERMEPAIPVENDAQA